MYVVYPQRRLWGHLKINFFRPPPNIEGVTPETKHENFNFQFHGYFVTNIYHGQDFGIAIKEMGEEAARVFLKMLQSWVCGVSKNLFLLYELYGLLTTRGKNFLIFGVIFIFEVICIFVFICGSSLYLNLYSLFCLSFLPFFSSRHHFWATLNFWGCHINLSIFVVQKATTPKNGVYSCLLVP